MPGAVGGSVGVSRGGLRRREARQGVVDLAQQGGHAGLLSQDAGEKVGEGWSFLFGPLRGEDLDHMGDLACQGLKLALEGLAVFKKSVLGVNGARRRWRRARLRNRARSPISPLPTPGPAMIRRRVKPSSDSETSIPISLR